MIFHLINSSNTRNMNFFLLRLVCIFSFNVPTFALVDNEVYRVGHP